MTEINTIDHFPRAGQLGHRQTKHECKPSGLGRAGITWYYLFQGRYLRLQAGLWTGINDYRLVRPL